MGLSLHFCIISAMMVSRAMAASSLIPGPSPLITPYRSEQPVVYMKAFYDPKYHDDGRFDQVTDTVTAKPKAKIDSKSISKYTAEERAAIIQKFKLQQNEKLYKRGLRNGVDFRGPGDSLAVESSPIMDNIQIADAPTPVRVKLVKEVHEVANAKSKKQQHPKPAGRQRQSVPKTAAPKVKGQTLSLKKTNTNQGKGDQLKTETKNNPKVAETQKQASAFKPGNPQSYYDNSANNLVHDFIHGRRKVKAYFFKPQRTPSLGKVFLESHSHIGYW